MGFLYETTDGSAKRFNGVSTRFVQSKDPDPALDGFVATGIVQRFDTLDNVVILAEAVEANQELTLNSAGKAVAATNATQVPAGSATIAGIAGAEISGNYYPVSANKAGNTALTASGDLVIGGGGRITNSLGGAVALASAVAVPASADFDNTMWDGVKNPIVETVADDATARGLIVSVYAINVLGAIEKITVELDADDSSVGVDLGKPVNKILAVGLSGAITTATFRIRDNVNNICMSVATPVAFTAPDTGTLYGAIATDDSNDPQGHSVLITASTAIAAGKHIGVLGTDDNDAVQIEAIAGAAAVTLRTTKQFKAVHRILVGDDNFATGTYAAEASQNTAAQKIGTAPAAGVAANALFKMKRV